MMTDSMTKLLPKDTPDSYFLSLAFRLKSRIPKPPQSKFRVFSIITFRDETIPSDSIGYLFGTNSETCVLSNCICAERSALVQLKLRPTSSLVDKVFIVCDSQVYITPGPLCREYMMENFCSENTIIITCGENQVPRQFTLGQLLPFPMIYLQIDRDNVLSYAKEFSQKCEQFLTKYNKTHPKWITLYKNMLSLARRERKIFLHPINYVAGVLFSDNQTVISQHHEAIEYGCSLDAVSRLTVFIERESKATPQLILQVDQYGTLHAPAAVARAYLEEKGYHSVNFVIHDKNGKLQLLRGSELMPYGAKSVDLVGKINL
jgi:cytidine deaminase